MTLEWAKDGALTLIIVGFIIREVWAWIRSGGLRPKPAVVEGCGNGVAEDECKERRTEIKAEIQGMREDNKGEHTRLVDKFDLVAGDVAEIKGYLEGSKVA